MSARLSIVVLHIGHPKPDGIDLMAATLDSLKGQALNRNDEFIVVTTHNSDHIAKLWREASVDVGAAGVLMRVGADKFGTAGQKRANAANYVIVIRDGDRFLSGSVKHIKQCLESSNPMTNWQFETTLSLLDGAIADLAVSCPAVVGMAREIARDTTRTVLEKFYIRKEDHEPSADGVRCTVYPVRESGHRS